MQDDVGALTIGPAHAPRQTGQSALSGGTDFERPVFALLGLPFDAITSDQTIERIRDAAVTGRRLFFSTPNLNFVVGCIGDAGFRDSVLASDLSVADGMPLVWVAKLLRVPIVERVAGSTLLESLRRTTSRAAIGVYLFGGPEGAAARAGEAINGVAGGLVCVGSESPGFGSIEELSDARSIARINLSGARFLIVAMSARKGQAWIMHNLAALEVPVIADLGAVVNFAAGTIRRAPEAWQRLGGEWIWRIKEEPQLWRRYWRDGLAFLRLTAFQVLPAAIDACLRAPSATELRLATVDVRKDALRIVIAPNGHWSATNLGSLRAALRDGASAEASITIDLAGVRFLDSAFVGLMMLLHGHQRKTGRGLEFLNAGRATRRRIAHYGATFLLSDQSP